MSACCRRSLARVMSGRSHLQCLKFSVRLYLRLAMVLLPARLCLSVGWTEQNPAGCATSKASASYCTAYVKDFHRQHRTHAGRMKAITVWMLLACALSLLGTAFTAEGPEEPGEFPDATTTIRYNCTQRSNCGITHIDNDLHQAIIVTLKYPDGEPALINRTIQPGSSGAPLIPHIIGTCNALPNISKARCDSLQLTLFWIVYCSPARRLSIDACLCSTIYHK